MALKVIQQFIKGEKLGGAEKSKSHFMAILCAFKLYYIHCVSADVHVPECARGVKVKQHSGISLLLHCECLGAGIHILSLGGNYVNPMSCSAAPQSFMS